MSLRLLLLAPFGGDGELGALRLPSGADVYVVPVTAPSKQLQGTEADVALLDLGSSRPKDGIWPEVVRQLSELHDFPVLVLGPSEPDLHEAALLAGAVGFVERTLAEHLLDYQISNLVNRLRGRARARRIVAGDLAIDLDSYTVRAAGSEIALSSLEFGLLSRLAERSGRVCARAELAAVGPDCRPLTHRSLENHMSRLRRKLASARSRCKIETAIGLGYRLMV